MRVLFWYCTRFDWVPASKTLEDAPEAVAAQNANVVVAFVHVEPGDPEPNSSAETKLVKNAKWLARKWDTRQLVLHSFTHLGEKKSGAAGSEAVDGKCRKASDSGGLHRDPDPLRLFQ